MSEELHSSHSALPLGGATWRHHLVYSFFKSGEFLEVLSDQARSQGGGGGVGGWGVVRPPQMPIPKILFHPLAILVPTFSILFHLAAILFHPLAILFHPFSNFVPPISNFVPPLEYVDDVTRTMSKGGGARLVFHPSKFRPPPPPHLAGWLRAW